MHIVTFVGEYWMDPNEGDIRDAILVQCKMETRATCVMPNPERTPEITHIGNEPEVWLGDIEDGHKVSVDFS